MSPFAGALTEKPLDDFLLFEVHLDQHILTDGLTAYRQGSHVFLPLGELSNLLTIAVSVNSEQKTATGFVITEDRPFALNLNTNSALIKGTKLPFDPQLVHIQGNEIYIDKALYTQWFPVDLNIDISSLTLKITPREQLPVQARLLREKQSQSEHDLTIPDFKDYDVPYSLLDKPFIDQTVEGGLSKHKDNGAEASGQYTTLLTADFLGLETHFIANGSDKKNLDNYRLTMGRNDPDGHLLGPARARSFAIGNINMPSQTYVAQANSTGRGFMVSNRLLTAPTQFDTQNFTGDLLPGWDVELFHNGNLIGHQDSNEKSKYEFNDIPLLFGSNDFRLVFHGPLGQLKEEHTRFMLEDSLVLPGETYYTLGSAQLEGGSTRTTAQVDQSLLPRLSATGGFVLDQNPESSTPDPLHPSRSYYNLGLRSYLDPFFLSADGITSSDGGTLGALAAKTGFWNSTLYISHAVLHDFISEEFQSSNDPIVASSKVRLDTFLPYLPDFPISLEGSRLQLASNENMDKVSAKVTTYLAGISISNRLSNVSTRGENSSNGELLLGGRISSYYLRAGVTYNIEPDAKATSLVLNGNVRLNQEYNFTQSVSNQLDSNETRFEMGLSKAIGKYGLGLTAGGTNQSEYFVGCRLNVAVGVEPRNSEVFTSALPMSATGAASIRAFWDKNLNGIMDEGDTPIEGVGFQVNGGMSSTRTDAKGFALVTHLPTGERVNFAVDRNTLEDPQMLPTKRGLRLLPRPGKVAEIDFPFVMTTEIDGVISINNNGEGRQPASNLKLELVDASDPEQVVSRTTTAYDGYYILTEVPPGNYVLQIEPEQAATLKSPLPQLKTFHILPNSAFINGMDMVVKLPNKEMVQTPDSLPPIVSPDKKNANRELTYVILGSYVLADSYKLVLKNLDELKIPYLEHPFRRSMKVFRIQADFKDAKSAKAATELLTKYNYSFTEKSGANSTQVFIGAYYTIADAMKEKSILTAALSTVTMTVATSVESIEMTELAVGGFENQNHAKQAAAIIKKHNFAETSIQKRPPSQWTKPQKK